jgi:hypothetical protein
VPANLVSAKSKSKQASHEHAATTGARKGLLPSSFFKERLLMSLFAKVKRGPMSHEEIEEWFFDTIQGLPPKKARAVKEWFNKREVAFQVLSKIEREGFSAFLAPDKAVP